MNPGSATSPLSFGSLAQLGFSLLLIVGMIIGLSWLMKRLRIAGPRSGGALVIIDQLAVGPRERIVLVGIGASQVLVGVGSHGVVALQPLPQPLLELPTAAPGPGTGMGSFAGKLRELLTQQGRGA